MERIEITIHTTNAAFVDVGPGAEAGQILQSIGRRFADGDYQEPGSYSVMDGNGNTVGTISIDKGDD
jgi:hypothetical protein